MHVVAGMTRQPISNLVDLVRTVVIHDEMHVQPGGKVFFDLVEKPQELLMPVPLVASADSGVDPKGETTR